MAMVVLKALTISMFTPLMTLRCAYIVVQQPMEKDVPSQKMDTINTDMEAISASIVEARLSERDVPLARQVIIQNK